MSPFKENNRRRVVVWKIKNQQGGMLMINDYFYVHIWTGSWWDALYIFTLTWLGEMYWVGKPCSIQFSHSVVSNSLRPHELQHARPPCPSPTPGVHSNSRPVMSSSRLILGCPLLLLPLVPPSIRVFSNESTLCMRWPKYWTLLL